MKKRADLDAESLRELSRAAADALVGRSRSLLQQIWANPSHDLPSLVDSDALFILQGQGVHLFRGSQLVEALGRQQWVFGLFSMGELACQVQSYREGTAVVTASFSATLQHNSAEDVPVEVFCTIVWRLTDARDTSPYLELCQMSVSEASLAGEVSVHFGTPSHLTARALPDAPPIALHSSDRRASTHWVIPDQILYVAAAHQYTNVYCVDRLVRMRAPFAKVVEQLGGIVVPVHRSYAVNPAHVSSLEDDELCLSNGARVPVPARRVKEIRELFSLGAAKVGPGE